MTDFFDSVSKVAVQIFVVTCMATAGLGLGFRDIVASLSRGRLVLFALVANFVVAPALAYSITYVFEMEQARATGLLLLSAAAGAPFLPKLAALAKGDPAFSVGLMLLLMVGSVAFMPIVLPLLIPNQSADPWPILRPLLLTMLLPLSIGMVVRSRSKHWADRVRPVFGKVSNASMILAVLLLIGLNLQEILGTIGSGAIALALLFEMIMLTVGYVLGGPSLGTRSVLALGTGQRNIAAALIIASQNSEDPKIVVSLIVFTLAGLFVLLPAARWFARRAATNSAKREAISAGPLHEGATL